MIKVSAQLRRHALFAPGTMNSQLIAFRLSQPGESREWIGRANQNKAAINGSCRETGQEAGQELGSE